MFKRNCIFPTTRHGFITEISKHSDIEFGNCVLTEVACFFVQLEWTVCNLKVLFLSTYAPGIFLREVKHTF